MTRKASPDQGFGPGSSIWATTESRDLLFDLAKSEERSVKIVLRRALLAYADSSTDYQEWLKSRKTRTKQPQAA